METLICNGALSARTCRSGRSSALQRLRAVCALAACWVCPEGSYPRSGGDAEPLYKEAQTGLTASNGLMRREAGREARKPISVSVAMPSRASIEIGYRYYTEGETAARLDATERLLKANPSHSNVERLLPEGLTF